MTIDRPEPATSYANLLQEFLLALLGHTGDVFVDNAPPFVPDHVRHILTLFR